MSEKTISPQQLWELQQGGRTIELIDVRTPAEFHEAHVGFARNVPLEHFDAAEVPRRQRADTPLYVICQSGGRGRQACEKLARNGLEAWNVAGGTAACIAAGLPIVRGQKTLSLERQVRIAAGSLVLVGVTLGWLVHPAFFGLSAFVGAGLVFAGLTDTCGMGMLLARMPWNQRGAPDTPCAAS